MMVGWSTAPPPSLAPRFQRHRLEEAIVRERLGDRIDVARGFGLRVRFEQPQHLLTPCLARGCNPSQMVQLRQPPK